MTKIAIFASGTGSNARKIIEHFDGKDTAQVVLIVSNRSKAGVLSLAKEKNIPALLTNKSELSESQDILKKISIYEPDLIVLAGFLLLIPEYLIDAFPNRMINIHPALLPKYGGKGMYGMNVHRAVFEAREPKSGITIHYVNKAYDEGSIIFQTECKLVESDHPEDIAKKVQQLEHHFYPKIIEQLAIQKEQTG